MESESTRSHTCARGKSFRIVNIIVAEPGRKPNMHVCGVPGISRTCTTTRLCYSCPRRAHLFFKNKTEEPAALALGLAQSVPRTATWHDQLRPRQQQWPGRLFFPSNAPGMDRFQLFDLVGYN